IYWTNELTKVAHSTLFWMGRSLQFCQGKEFHSMPSKIYCFFYTYKRGINFSHSFSIVVKPKVHEGHCEIAFQKSRTPASCPDPFLGNCSPPCLETNAFPHSLAKPIFLVSPEYLVRLTADFLNSFPNTSSVSS